MIHPITEHVAKSPRHTSFYLACGPADGTPVIFVHGWPELSLSWRHQLPVLAALGFRAIAPDMRGYGRSSCYPRQEDYALEHSVADMIELLDSLGHQRAVWVGHDWGAPVVWSIASHHPERCHGVANLCVPHFADGFAPENFLPLVDREVYPEAEYPAGQWDYQLFYMENFDRAHTAFEADVNATVKALFRKGSAAGRKKPSRTSTTRRDGGWFGGLPKCPDFPRDADVLTEADRDLRQEMQKLQRELSDLDTRLLRQVTGDIRDVLTKYAQENKFSMVFDASTMAYSDPKLDMTDEVLKRMGVDPKVRKEAKEKDKAEPKSAEKK